MEGVAAAAVEPTLRFTLHHLNATCPVTYNAKGWLKASRDHLTARLAPVVLRESSREPVAALFNAVRGPLPPSTIKGSLAGISVFRDSSVRPRRHSDADYNSSRMGVASSVASALLSPFSRWDISSYA